MRRKKLGILDEVADPNALMHAAVSAAKGLADGTLKPNREPKGGALEGRLSRDPLYEPAPSAPVMFLYPFA